ncbi:hypothetical protein V5F77_12095 [Xanthobacter sp. DSM 24535]|uniref:hypothetical protein n=1 Tax=Roseixanthobacter psychrophilus TaxID=3119917 RepID=UPI003727C2AB
MVDNEAGAEAASTANRLMMWDEVERAAKELGADKFRVFGAHEGEAEPTIWFGATYLDENGKSAEVISPPFENISTLAFIEGFDAMIARAFLAELGERVRRSAAVRAFRVQDSAERPPEGAH